jgi:hypothetical protein
MLVSVTKHKSEPGKFLIIPGYYKSTGEFVRESKPKGGYWQVVWVRKPPKGLKRISNLLRSRAKAKKFAEVINSLPPKTARWLIRELITRGRAIQYDFEAERGLRDRGRR